MPPLFQMLEALLQGAGARMARVLDCFAWLVAIVIPTSYFQTWCETDATVDFFKNCGGDICRS